MSANDTSLLYALGVIAAALAIALLWRAFVEWKRRRRSAWCKRFADIRFSPSAEEARPAAVAAKFAKYDQPTYLRTPREEEELTPFLRRQG